MSKNSIKNCHLIYAAVHQNAESYNRAVLVDSISSIIKTAMIGAILYLSSPESIPILNRLIANL